MVVILNRRKTGVEVVITRMEQDFYCLGLGRGMIFFFLWDWDRTGMKIYSHVTL